MIFFTYYLENCHLDISLQAIDIDTRSLLEILIEYCVALSLVSDDRLSYILSDTAIIDTKKPTIEVLESKTKRLLESSGGRYLYDTGTFGEHCISLDFLTLSFPVETQILGYLLGDYILAIIHYDREDLLSTKWYEGKNRLGHSTMRKINKTPIVSLHYISLLPCQPVELIYHIIYPPLHLTRICLRIDSLRR